VGDRLGLWRHGDRHAAAEQGRAVVLVGADPVDLDSDLLRLGHGDVEVDRLPGGHGGGRGEALDRGPSVVAQLGDVGRGADRGGGRGETVQEAHGAVAYRRKTSRSADHQVPPHGRPRRTRMADGRPQPDCLFCKIVAGEIPATAVRQTDLTFAFKDINPQAPVHDLIVPRAHYANAAELAEYAPELAAAV